jgi:hypothetical protein
VALTVFAEIGPFLPSERSLPVLVGGGFVLGDFLYTVFMGTGALTIESIRRRRLGVFVGAICLAAWVIGHLADAADYPWIGADRSFLDVGGWFGMGPVLAAALLRAVAGRKLFNSDNLNLENEGAEQTGRSFGLLLAGAYLFIWSGIEAVPSDGHEAMQSIAQLIP